MHFHPLCRSQWNTLSNKTINSQSIYINININTQNIYSLRIFAQIQTHINTFHRTIDARLHVLPYGVISVPQYCCCCAPFSRWTRPYVFCDFCAHTANGLELYASTVCYVRSHIPYAIYNKPMCAYTETAQGPTRVFLRISVCTSTFYMVLGRSYVWQKPA